jgi:pectin lyase
LKILDVLVISFNPQVYRMNILNMKPFQAVTVAMLALLAHHSIAVPTDGASTIKSKRAISPLVSGTPPGFASGTTGGGTATPVYPSTIAQLKTYLTSTSPQVIVISGTYDFGGSEGTVTKPACNAYSCAPAAGGQALLNTLGGCGTTATYNVNIDAAAFNPLWIQSHKTLIGKNGATIKGKGFRLAGVTNIIIQNIAITNLNPAYVWGGDAFALTGATNVWIDHVTASDQRRIMFISKWLTSSLFT